MSLHTPRRYTGWSVLAAGVLAGIAVVAFLVIPWPLDLLVLPALAAWALSLAALFGRKGRSEQGWLVVLVGLTAFGLGGLAIGVLVLFLP